MSYSTLRCPRCGEDYDMDQLAVHAWFRRNEDSIIGMHSLTTIAGCITDEKQRGNPSERRQGASILFHCSSCGNDNALYFAQVKGQTQLYWEGGESVALYERE